MELIETYIRLKEAISEIGKTICFIFAESVMIVVYNEALRHHIQNFKSKLSAKKRLIHAVNFIPQFPPTF